MADETEGGEEVNELLTGEAALAARNISTLVTAVSALTGVLVYVIKVAVEQRTNHRATVGEAAIIAKLEEVKLETSCVKKGVNDHAQESREWKIQMAEREKARVKFEDDVADAHKTQTGVLTACSTALTVLLRERGGES